MSKTATIIAAALLGICGFVLVALMHAGPVFAGAPHWTEVSWPFPMDQWGKGKTFACNAADCGTDVTIYVRAKIGFCNCTTGVADDNELDRIGDYDLFDNKLMPQGEGHPITIGWMKGRSRAFMLAASRAGKSALVIGFNDHCDAVIATAVLADERPAAAEPIVLDFLKSQQMLHWVEVTLGL